MFPCILNDVCVICSTLFLLLNKLQNQNCVIHAIKTDEALINIIITDSDLKFCARIMQIQKLHSETSLPYCVDISE